MERLILSVVLVILSHIYFNKDLNIPGFQVPAIEMIPHKVQAYLL